LWIIDDGRITVDAMANDGLFQDDPADAIDVLQGRVLTKKMMGPAGLELRPTDARGGMAGYSGLRRASLSTRMDLQIIWRAVIVRGGRSETPAVLFIAPQNHEPAEAGEKLAAAGIVLPGIAGPEAYEVHPADSSAAGLIAFAVQGLQTLGYSDPFWEWQWITRDKSYLPKR
jgi:hypothetical protein